MYVNFVRHHDRECERATPLMGKGGAAAFATVMLMNGP